MPLYPDGAKARELLWTRLIESYREQYKERWEVWRNLEAKAQGTVTIAGIFIGGVFAFIRESSNATILDRAGLGLTVVALILAVIWSVRVLLIRHAPTAPNGDAIAYMFWDMLEGSDAEMLRDFKLFVRGYTRAWADVNAKLSLMNEDKAKFLGRSQRMLGAAVGLMALLTLIRIVFAGQAPSLHV
jgi:hypothetical protein